MVLYDVSAEARSSRTSMPVDGVHVVFRLFYVFAEEPQRDETEPIYKFDYPSLKSRLHKKKISLGGTISWIVGLRPQTRLPIYWKRKLWLEPMSISSFLTEPYGTNPMNCHSFEDHVQVNTPVPKVVNRYHLVGGVTSRRNLCHPGSRLPLSRYAPSYTVAYRAISFWGLMVLRRSQGHDLPEPP